MSQNPYKPEQNSPTQSENPFSPPSGPVLPKRSVIATVVGWVCAVIAVLALLTDLRNLLATRVNGNPGYLIGEILGMLLVVGIPALIAYLCLTSHTRKAKKTY